MSYLDTLLEGAEVEWKTLGEVGEFIRGRRFVKTDILSEGTPCIHYGEMYTHYGIWADKSKSFISTELASKLRTASNGDVVFVAAGETIEDIGKGTAWLGDEDVVIHDACFFYKSSLNPKYVAYFSRTSFFHDQIKKSISSGKISAINAKGFEKVIIPIPPLAAQAEIVRILDTFTALTAELTARKKQYEYYREQLLSFEEGEVEWKALGEVCDILTGFPFDSSQFKDTGTKLMRGVNVKRGVLSFNENDDRYWENISGLEKYLLHKDDIVISMDGSLVGKSFGVVKEINLPLILVQRVARVRSTSADVNIKYVFFYITNWFFSYVEQKKTQGAIPHISQKDISSFKIPIPPLEEQARIVSILDKFDTLTTSISEGLPKEIALRKQQYEYYRDILLNF